VSVKSQRTGFNLRRYLYWTRDNLFNDKLNTVLTVVMTAAAVAFAFFIVRYVVDDDTNWGVVTNNLRLLFIGDYPLGSELRLWIPLALGMTLLGVIFGIWGSVRTYTTVIGTSVVLLLVLGFDFIPSWLNALSFGLAIPFESVSVNADGVETQTISTSWLALAGILVGSYALSWAPRIPLIRGRSLRSYSGNPIVFQSVMLAVVLVILIAILLQQGIFPSKWGGIFIDIMVFSVGGGVIMFPLGLMLALARGSRYPVLSYASTVYIEIIRAGPLIVWLYFAFFLWDDFSPFVPDFPIRAMLVFGFFGSAYIAEVIRGGLQSLPKGQYEAAFSLNLTTFTTYTRIILPQAVRAVVPAIIGRFISIWKDTSLLAGLEVGIINLLGAGQGVLGLDAANRESLIEIYLVIVLLYWLVSFAFSRFGRYTEKKLNL